MGWHKNFEEALNAVKFLVLAQKIWTGTKFFATCKRARHKTHIDNVPETRSIIQKGNSVAFKTIVYISVLAHTSKTTIHSVSHNLQAWLCWRRVVQVKLLCGNGQKMESWWTRKKNFLGNMVIKNGPEWTTSLLMMKLAKS